ncbi:MAG: hypothetical protein ACRDNX_00485 [Gaiellaceae bacterium]
MLTATSTPTGRRTAEMTGGRTGLASVLAAAAALLLASAGSGTRTIDGISGTARLVEVRAELMLVNSGTTRLLFDRGTVPGGKTLTSASQDGQGCRISGSQFNCGPFSVQPGGAFTIALQTTPALQPSDGPFTMFVSSDGVTDSGPFTIPWQPVAAPPPPPPPPPPPGPCICRNIGVTTSGWGDFTARGADTTSFSFRGTWRMNCSGAAGKCAGRIEVIPPAGTDLRLTAPKKAIGCKGTCRADQAITLSRGSFRVAGSSAASLDPEARGGKSFSFRIKRYCIRGGKRVSAGGTFMTVVYRPSGILDRAKSDLNGDRKPDG